MSTIPLQLQEDVGKLVEQKVAQYGYADASDYVRDLISRDEAHGEWLRQQLQDGLDSGISPLSIDEAFERGFERARRKCA